MSKRYTSTGVLTIIAHPLVLSLVALLLTVLIVPKEFSKHHLDLIRTGYEGDIYRESVYMDINGDGINEKILMRNLNTNANIVALTQNESYVATWKLPGFWYTEPDYSFGDPNMNGIVELFCISINSGDSILVTQMELSDESDLQRSRYVCKLYKINDALDHIIQADGLMDVTGDSVPDFIFHISAGYSLQPRTCYAWDLENDTVITSPFAGINIRDIHMETSKEGGIDHGIRLFSNVASTQNYTEPVPYSDTASYAVVFSKNLQFLFEPLYTGGRQSNTVTLPFQYEGEDQILAVTNDKRKDNGRISLRVMNQMGSILASKDSIDLLKTVVPFVWNGEVYLHQRNDLEFSFCKVGPDLQLDEVSTGEGSFALLKNLDFDADGQDELLMIDGAGQAFAILEEDLESFTRVSLSERIAQVSSVSIKSMDLNHTEIFVQTQGIFYLLDYYPNSFYPFRWSYYILLYLMYALVFVGLQRLFVYRSQKKKETEEKIVKLQLQSVMNQLNPHFTFNAINSIGLAMMEGKSMEAYEYYLRGRRFYYQFSEKDIQFAIRMYKKAIECDSQYALAYGGLSECYSYLYMYSKTDKRNLLQANQSSKVAIKLDPLLAEAWTSRGVALSLKNKYKKAEKAFEKAIEIDPMLFETCYQYARMSFAQGNYEKAASLYNRASEIRPDDYQPPLLSAQSYEEMGQMEKANELRKKGIEIAEENLKFNPGDTRALSLAANGLAAIGENEKAMNFLQRALILEPDDPMLLYNAGCIYAIIGSENDALNCLEKSADTGLTQKDWYIHDGNLASIRESIRFKKMLERME